MPEQRYAVDTLPFGGDEDQPHEFGRLLSQKIVSEGETFYHHYDALGSTAALTDSAEVVTDEYDYNAFGDTVASTGVTPNPCQWVAEYGYRRDEESGLYDLRRRNYDTQSGRFLSEDPVRHDEENLYRYVGNNPVNEIDPSGLDSIQLTKKRIDTDRWGKRTETPEHNSPVVWVVKESDYTYLIPSIPYATDSLRIGKYNLANKSVELSEKFGGGELPLEFLESYAESETATGRSGTTESVVKKMIEEAESVHA